MADAADFARLIEPLARKFFGAPTSTAHGGNELRFRTRGSLIVNTQTGQWYDHEAGEGGGVLDLVQRETGLQGPDRIQWLEREGFLNGRNRRERQETAHYDYVDEAGNLLSQVVRYVPKTFRQRRPDGHGGWIWEIKGIRQVPYRLPELVEAIASDRLIFIPEGEKDVDRLWQLGAPATCNAGGAGNWKEDLNQYFSGAHVIIIADNDPQTTDDKGQAKFHPDGRPRCAGFDHANYVAAQLDKIADEVRVLDLGANWPDCPIKGDISDFFDAGKTLEELYALADSVPLWDRAQARKDALGAPKLAWFNIAVLDGMPVPQQPWAVHNRIPARNLTLLTGHGGTGKSTMGRHLCVAHALGQHWLGSMPEQGPSINIDAEDDEGVIHRQLEAIRLHYGCTYKEISDAGFHVMSRCGEDCVMGALNKNGVIAPTEFYKLVLEVASDIKPVQIVIANLACVFAGSENDRAQVQQFISLLQRIVLRSGGALTLLTHPSVAGLANKTGLSGSTQWHNAVRSQMWLHGLKKGDEEEQPDDDLRVLDFMKNQYGYKAESVKLRYQNGLFLPEGAVASSPADKAAWERQAEEVFMEILNRITRTGDEASPKETSHNYAPNKFAKQPEAKAARMTKPELAAAMVRLFEKNYIQAETSGPPSKRKTIIKL